MKPSVLVVEDDTALAQMLVRALGRCGYEMGLAGTWAEARSKLDAQAPDVVLLDMNLPDAQDFGPLKEIASDRPTIMLTAYGSIDQAVQAMRLGAADYLVKPVNLDELELVIRRALDGGRLRASMAVHQAASSARRTPDMLGDSPAMQRLHGLIGVVADTDVTVLVTGESGVGKELVAHALHQASRRRAAPFVAVDCCTLQESLFESELFGHERGAFTGADRRKPGLIEAAAGGTLFLDEIGDIGAALQAKLLRVIETGRFRRVGATADLRADVRIVAATNADLIRMVRDGRFRADLYYRLSAFIIEVPPLRQRREDLLQLVRHFSERATRLRDPVRFSAEALERLAAHDWPGNVRELRNVVERAVLLAADTGLVQAQHLPLLRVGEGSAPPGAPGAGAVAPAATLPAEPPMRADPPRASAGAPEAAGEMPPLGGALASPWPRPAEAAAEESRPTSADPGAVTPMPDTVAAQPAGAVPPPRLEDALAAEWPTLHDIEARYLALLLAHHGGNRRKVAETMGISERTAYRMLK